MATLVTGGTGFVGANIVKSLAEAGHEVISLDVESPDRLLQDFLGELYPRIRFIQGDILDRAAVERLGADFSLDKIVHAAVYTVNRVPLEIERSRAVIDINIEGTANLLELARTRQVGRFIYVSSGAVYGDTSGGDRTLNEESAVAPQNLYSISKYASELLTRRYGHLHGFSTATARLSTPYGPMERVTGHRAVMSVFCEWTGQVVRGEAIRAEEMDQGRDYTYAADIADGVRAVLDTPVLPHDLYNVTAGAWVTHQEVVQQLIELSPSTQVISPAGSEPPVYSRGPLSGQRLANDLKWAPKYDLKAGLTEYLQWRRDSEFFD